MDNKTYFKSEFAKNRDSWMEFGGSKVNPLTSIPNRQSDGSQWRMWHEVLSDNFGKKQANSLFLKAWKKQAGPDASTHDLRSYLEKNGIFIEKGILESAVDSGHDIGDQLGEFLKIGKYAVYAIGGITILGFGMLVYNVMKNPIAAAKAASSFTPAGRLAK